MNRLTYLILFPLLAITALCHADDLSPPTSTLTPPPNIPEDSFKDVPDTIEKRLSLHFKLGNFVGHFEKTTLKDIRNLTKAGDIQEQGEAGGNILWLCYTLRHATRPQRLWIIASGEMGGPQHAVTEIIAESLEANTTPTASCPTLPARLHPVSIDDKIWIGMKSTDLIKKLGKPSKMRGDLFIYSHLGKLANDFDEVGWLVVRQFDGRAVFVGAGKTTSN